MRSISLSTKLIEFIGQSYKHVALIGRYNPFIIEGRDEPILVIKIQRKLIWSDALA